MSKRFECVFVEDRFVIISTDEFECRIYYNVDDDCLNLEQILDLLNGYEVLCSTLWSVLMNKDRYDEGD